MKNNMPSYATSQQSAKTAPASQGTGRIHFLDELRGLTLVSMILYHFMWDLAYIVGLSMPWYHSMGAYIWQQSICWTFILLSGFCWSLGHHPFKRGMIVFFCGIVVTAVTLLLGEDYTILFGVLTLIGSCMLLMIPLDLLDRLLFFTGVTNASVHKAARLLLTVLSFVLFWYCRHSGNLLPAGISRNLFTAYLGFPFQGFYSTDYFPLLPWFFLYLTGYQLHKLCQTFHTPGTRIDAFVRVLHVPCFSFLGRHCLLIYMLHQPVLYLISILIAGVIH